MLQAKQGFQKSLREKQAQHAEAEKAARQQREKEQIEKERKKLTRLKEERNKMRNDILFAKRDEIVKEKKEKERQVRAWRRIRESTYAIATAACVVSLPQACLQAGRQQSCCVSGSSLFRASVHPSFKYSVLPPIVD